MRLPPGVGRLWLCSRILPRRPAARILRQSPVLKARRAPPAALLLRTCTCDGEGGCWKNASEEVIFMKMMAEGTPVEDRIGEKKD